MLSLVSPVSGPGHEHFRDAPRPDHPPHDGHSPASRERSSSLQGMDMASLPPRKRPWHDGPGTSEHREMEAPGGPSEDRGGKGQWRPVINSGGSSVKKAAGPQASPIPVFLFYPFWAGYPGSFLHSPLQFLGCVKAHVPKCATDTACWGSRQQSEPSLCDCRLILCISLLHLLPRVPSLVPSGFHSCCSLGYPRAGCLVLSLAHVLSASGCSGPSRLSLVAGTMVFSQLLCFPGLEGTADAQSHKDFGEYGPEGVFSGAVDYFYSVKLGNFILDVALLARNGSHHVVSD